MQDAIHSVAKNGDPNFQWTELKPLIKDKIEQVLMEVQLSSPDVPVTPNVEPFVFSDLKNKILSQLEAFTSAPFTIQRVCELLLNPSKHYKRIDKFMRGLEKNLLVVSTVEPGVSLLKPEEDTSAHLVNGISDEISVSPLHLTGLTEEGVHSVEESVTGDVVTHFPPEKSPGHSFTSSDSSEDSEASSEEEDYRRNEMPEQSEVSTSVIEQLQAMPVDEHTVAISDSPHVDATPVDQPITTSDAEMSHVAPEASSIDIPHSGAESVPFIEQVTSLDQILPETVVPAESAEPQATLPTEVIASPVVTESEAVSAADLGIDDAPSADSENEAESAVPEALPTAMVAPEAVSEKEAVPIVEVRGSDVLMSDAVADTSSDENGEMSEKPEEPEERGVKRSLEQEPGSYELVEKSPRLLSPEKPMQPIVQDLVDVIPDTSDSTISSSDVTVSPIQTTLPTESPEVLLQEQPSQSDAVEGSAVEQPADMESSEAVSESPLPVA